MNINEYREFIKQAYENYPVFTSEIAAFEKNTEEYITRIHYSAATQAAFGRGISATEHLESLIPEKISFLKMDIAEAYKKANIDHPELNIFQEEKENVNPKVAKDQGKDAVEAFQTKSKLNKFDENNRSIENLKKGDFLINANDIKRKDENEPDKD